MTEIDMLLRELADDPSDYERDGGTALLVRQGNEHVIELREIPGVGVAVEASDMDGKARTFIPLTTYVQRDLLELPRLARQIIRSLERSAARRPGRFVEGPAACAIGPNRVIWTETSKQLRQHLNEAELGTTRLVQLMAAAGQGKTVLLEYAALESAQIYQPDQFPIPLLLPVDLLGRYVGTIDDAIAGSLNNTYMFPGLTQRDVALCVRRRWMILALDGFDELVARVGARDAFLRISELLDQLNGSGTVLVSARESFFELYQITNAIRTYLQPSRGSYNTTAVNLLPWKREQGVEVFQALGSKDPDVELDALLQAFEGDTEIVLHPFFLTRLADLWIRGERFAGAGVISDRLARTNYVIETFIQRESGEKWINREGKPILNPFGHRLMLGNIAGEMWRSGAFRLTADEVRIAAAIGLAFLHLAPSVVEGLMERAPTHAALQSAERGYSFLHDRFLHYFLGFQVAHLLQQGETETLRAILSARELGPHITEWVVWNWTKMKEGSSPVLAVLGSISDTRSDTVLAENVAYLVAKLLAGYRHEEPITVLDQTYVGDAFACGEYYNIVFRNCSLWTLELKESVFCDCRFESCHFGDIRLDAATRFTGSHFHDCKFVSVELSENEILYVPEQIEEYIRTRGGTVSQTQVVLPVQQVPRIAQDALLCIEGLVRASEKSTDIAVEDLEERLGPKLGQVVRIGKDKNVFREVSKQASGPRKTFIRVKVNRSQLLAGHVTRSGDDDIDAFWAAIAARFPHRK
jgi:hypothetical protein